MSLPTLSVPCEWARLPISIFAAAVGACRDESVLRPKVGKQVSLKWPNDLYALVGEDKDDLRKNGGVLVTANFRRKNSDCGGLDF